MNFKSIIFLLFVSSLLLGCQGSPKSKLPKPIQEAHDKMNNLDFEGLTCENITSLENIMVTDPIFTLKGGKKTLNEGSIVIFKTSKKQWGKMVLLENKLDLKVKIVRYNYDCSEGLKSDVYTIFNKESYDLDRLHNTIKDRDLAYTSAFDTERVRILFI